jgi:hypothetical protein
MHGDVESIAIAIFEDEELAALTPDVHALQADISTDAVFFVYDRRTGR